MTKEELMIALAKGRLRKPDKGYCWAGFLIAGEVELEGGFNIAELEAILAVLKEQL